MPRIARIVAVGLPHHITQRGNYRQEVFLDDSDRSQYLSWIRDYSLKYRLSILAYCLMQNHVHFIAIPKKDDSLAKTFNAAHMRYSQYFNKKIKARGHLWQGRFYSCILDQPHLLMASRYIERNPVRSGLVKKPWEWKWSSAPAHTGRENNLLTLGDLFKLTDMSSDSWKHYIDTKEEGKALEAIRRHTYTGRPIGTIDFVKKLEEKFGRRLLALPRGRPREKPE